MLILIRQVMETIRIGDQIEVTVLGVKGTQVRLGITAPRSIPVHREEVFVRIQAEQGAAATPAPSVPEPEVLPVKVKARSKTSRATRTTRDRPGG